MVGGASSDLRPEAGGCCLRRRRPARGSSSEFERAPAVREHEDGRRGDGERVIHWYAGVVHGIIPPACCHSLARCGRCTASVGRSSMFAMLPHCLQLRLPLLPQLVPSPPASNPLDIGAELAGSPIMLRGPLPRRRGRVRVRRSRLLPPPPPTPLPHTHTYWLSSLPTHAHVPRPRLWWPCVRKNAGWLA